jgi:hypothetical protein
MITAGPGAARSALGIAIAASALSAAAHSQTPSPPSVPPTGAIVGRVIDGATGTSLSGVIVLLTGTGLRPQRVIVDGQGRFLFHQLPRGTFVISATKPGYLPGSYGLQRADGVGRPLDLAEGERVLDATVRMWPFATISGTVTDDAGDPVPARVQAFRRTMLAGRWRLTNTTLGGNADERGGYRITGLTPGEYALVVTSMTSALPSSLLSLADVLKRTPPAEAALIQTELWANGAGGFVSDLMQGFSVTRVGDMMMQNSGNAIVGLDGRTVETYPTVWYPAAPTPAEASLITIRAGDNRTGIDLKPTLTRTLRVSGTVHGPSGPVPHLAMRLVPAGVSEAAAEITASLAGSLTTAMTVTDINGAFTFLAVPSGQYIIRTITTPRPPAEPAPPPPTLETGGMRTTLAAGPAPPPLVTMEPTWWAAVPVSVSEKDTTGVTVTLQPGVRVTGRVEFEGTATRPTGAELRASRVSMDPADGRIIGYASAYQAQIDPGGRFYTVGLMAGRYFLRADAPPRGWTIKSAMVGGRDILDSPLALESSDVDGLVITFTDRPSGLGGTVRNARGQPDAGATVLVFPVTGAWTDLGSSPRRLKSARTLRNGTFSLPGLPAGEYFVVAIDDELASNWQDPAFLQRLARVATRVTIAAGQTLMQDLSTATGISR